MQKIPLYCRRLRIEVFLEHYPIIRHEAETNHPVQEWNGTVDEGRKNIRVGEVDDFFSDEDEERGSQYKD